MPIRLVLVVTLIGFAALAPGSAGQGAAGPDRLPAPITVISGSGRGEVSVVIATDGSVRRIGNPPSSFPQDTACCAGPGLWLAIRHRHLVIGRNGRTVWRSAGEFRPQFGIDAQVGNRTVAFSYGGNLYLAPLGGAERPIGRQEYALGFTSGGVYTISWIRGLLLRSDTGAILKKIVHWTPQYFVARGRLYYIAHGVLMSADGARIQRLASLASLGMSADVGLQPLSADPWSQAPGGLIELEDNDRVTVLRPDGSVFAWASARQWGGGGISMSPVVAPHPSAIAFTAIVGQRSTSAIVYVLREGAHAATAVYRRRVQLGGCASGAWVQWHGSWLLYTDTAGDVVAVDTKAPRRVIDLTRLARRLGSRPGFDAYWSGRPPEL